MRLCHHRIKIHQLMFLACVLIPRHIAKVTMPWQAAKFKSTHMVNGGGGGIQATNKFSDYYLHCGSSDAVYFNLVKVVSCCLDNHILATELPPKYIRRTCYRFNFRHCSLVVWPKEHFSSSMQELVQ